MPREDERLFDKFISETQQYRCKYMEILIAKYVETPSYFEYDIATGKIVNLKRVPRKRSLKPFGTLTSYSCESGRKSIRILKSRISADCDNSFNEIEELSSDDSYCTEEEYETESSDTEENYSSSDEKDESEKGSSSDEKDESEKGSSSKDIDWRLPSRLSRKQSSVSDKKKPQLTDYPDMKSCCVRLVKLDINSLEPALDCQSKSFSSANCLPKKTELLKDASPDKQLFALPNKIQKLSDESRSFVFGNSNARLKSFGKSVDFCQKFISKPDIANELKCKVKPPKIISEGYYIHVKAIFSPIKCRTRLRSTDSALRTSKIKPLPCAPLVSKMPSKFSLNSIGIKTLTANHKESTYLHPSKTPSVNADYTNKTLCYQQTKDIKKNSVSIHEEEPMSIDTSPSEKNSIERKSFNHYNSSKIKTLPCPVLRDSKLSLVKMTKVKQRISKLDV